VRKAPAAVTIGLNQGNGHAGALTADSRLALEPGEQDSSAFYLQFAYRKVESALAQFACGVGGEVWKEAVKSPQSYNSSKTMCGEIARAFGNLEWRPHL